MSFEDALLKNQPARYLGRYCTSLHVQLVVYISTGCPYPFAVVCWNRTIIIRHVWLTLMTKTMRSILLVFVVKIRFCLWPKQRKGCAFRRIYRFGLGRVNVNRGVAVGFARQNNIVIFNLQHARILRDFNNMIESDWPALWKWLFGGFWLLLGKWDVLWNKCFYIFMQWLVKIFSFIKIHLYHKEQISIPLFWVIHPCSFIFILNHTWQKLKILLYIKNISPCSEYRFNLGLFVSSDLLEWWRIWLNATNKIYLC